VAPALPAQKTPLGAEVGVEYVVLKLQWTVKPAGASMPPLAHALLRTLLPMMVA
jgi:hypothetical protein